MIHPVRATKFRLPRIFAIANEIAEQRSLPMFLWACAE